MLLDKQQNFQQPWWDWDTTANTTTFIGEHDCDLPQQLLSYDLDEDVFRSIRRSVAELFSCNDETKVQSQGVHFAAFTLNALMSNHVGFRCPFTHDLVKATDSYIVSHPANDTLFYGYRFCSKIEYYVFLVGGLPSQVLGVFLPELNTSFVLGLVNNKSLMKYGIEGLRDSVKRIHRPQEIKDNGNAVPKVSVLVGEYFQFAHNLWNELPVLKEILDCVPAEALVVYSKNEPNGPIEEIYPELKRAKVIHCRHKSSLAITQEAHSAGHILVPVGGRRIDSNTIQRVLRGAQNRFPRDQAAAVSLRASHSLVVWLNTRQDVRILLNEVEVLTELLCHLIDIHKNVAMIFDGTTPGYGSGAWATEAELAVFRKITAAVRSSGRDFTSVALPGASLLQAYVWSSAADFYISGHGTPQHKIGWLQPIPGIVHRFKSDDFRISDFEAYHVVENRSSPILIQGSTSSPSKTKAGETRKDLFDYTIDKHDLKTATDSVISQIQPRIPEERFAFQNRDIELHDAYWNDIAADDLLSNAFRQWGERSGDPFELFLASVEESPKYPKAVFAFCRFILISMLASGRPLPLEKRLSALNFLLEMDVQNVWVTQQYVAALKAAHGTSFGSRHYENLRQLRPDLEIFHA